jgi:hypothetical protein
MTNFSDVRILVELRQRRARALVVTRPALFVGRLNRRTTGWRHADPANIARAHLLDGGRREPIASFSSRRRRNRTGRRH